MPSIFAAVLFIIFCVLYFVVAPWLNRVNDKRVEQGKDSW